MASLFSETTLERVRTANDIIDVIGAVLPLKRAGANFVALCPFHKEKTPSFSVNPQRQIFHCFGCHKGGNVFRFLQDYENLSFPEAVRRLAERAKIPLETTETATQAQNRSSKDALIGLHEQITQHWQKALEGPSGQIARAYLSKRGVSAEAVQLFRIGYAPEAWDDTVNWARAKHYELPQVELAGLIIRKEGSSESRYYDRFRGRLMFPICDEQGRVIAFSGRILSGDEKTAKYVNSPETPIFTKSRVFYGLDKAKRALVDSEVAVVCEGQLDLIACYMGGVHNVVAPQGTAFTAEHANILKRYVDEVVLCFDSDTAGQTAAVRVLDSLVASGLAIRVATLPAPHDPDSFIKQFGGPAFQTLIHQAPGFFDFYLERLCTIQDVGTDKGQLGVTRAMAEALHKTGNSVLLDKYAQKTALRLGVAPEAVRSEFRKGSRPSPKSDSSSPPTATSEPVAKPSSHEFWLLKILLLHDDLAEWLAAHLDVSWVRHAVIRQITAQRFSQEPGESWMTAAALLTRIEDESTRRLVTEILAEDRAVPNPQQQLADIVLRLRNLSIERSIAALVQRADRPDLGEAERSEIRQRLQALRQAKLQPLTSLPEPPA